MCACVCVCERGLEEEKREKSSEERGAHVDVEHGVPGVRHLVANHLLLLLHQRCQCLMMVLLLETMMLALLMINDVLLLINRFSIAPRR